MTFATSLRSGDSQPSVPGWLIRLVVQEVGCPLLMFADPAPWRYRARTSAEAGVRRMGCCFGRWRSAALCHTLGGAFKTRCRQLEFAQAKDFRSCSRSSSDQAGELLCFPGLRDAAVLNTARSSVKSAAMLVLLSLVILISPKGHVTASVNWHHTQEAPSRSRLGLIQRTGSWHTRVALLDAVVGSRKL